MKQVKREKEKSKLP
jgi:hypothetical protein